ncbi:asparaginase [Benzoatithermus flavus]|uniref:Asparaginase n=1 Tax=Benzoatithermus flavus TaxID=3108223 RepID=A0ABU8XW81_9PROT
MATTPVAIEVWRGERVESRHRVRACVVDADGRTVLAVGDVDEPVFPRSAVKPFQALALLETGAADRYGVSDAEIALACASHGGEPEHVSLVEAWLKRLGLDESALACGPHPPLYAPAAAALIREGKTPRRVHNNCSGKHTGMLAAALQLETPTKGYEHVHHPVQRHVAAAIAELSGLEALPEPGIDGCSLPNHPLPLRGLARAAARLADPSGLAPMRAKALERVAHAMRAHPRLVAGTGRCCTAVMEATSDVVAKTGAEGVYLAAVCGRGLGVAVKAEDGATRAAEAAFLAVLDHLDALDERAKATLAPFMRPVLRNFAGLTVGRIAPVPGWPAAS